MKTKLSTVEKIGWGFASSILLVPIAYVIAQSLPISKFPNVSTPNNSDLFVLAQTQAPIMDKNIRYDQLKGSIISGLATESYVNNSTNGLATTNYANQVASNRVVVLSGTNNYVVMTSTNGTNFYAVNSTDVSGFAAFETLTNGTRVGLSTNNNWEFGVTGRVSGTTVHLGIDSLALSNTLGFASVNAFQTNQFTTNVAGTPVQGSLWFSDTNGTAVTNGPRVALEYIPVMRSLRFGAVFGNITHPVSLGGASSNYWNSTNIGPVTVAFGSNVQAKAAYSSVSGGAMNIILTNSTHSVIAGGYNNFIDTNLATSAIGGGGFNQIYGRPTLAQGITISGGSNNIVNGTATSFSTIAGGGDNSIEHDYGTIAGGFANRIENTASAASFAFIGGGNQNQVGENGGTDSSIYGVVCGGNANLARGTACFIGGGSANNLLANDNDYSVIVGGQGNGIGVAAGELEAKWSFIGGGTANAINDGAYYAVITGGRENSILGSTGTNTVISGGAFNTAGINTKFVFISGGERNSVSGNYSFAVGTSNNVTSARAGAVGNNVTNNVADTVVVGNLVDYRQITTVSGAGSGSTNYTLQAISPKSYLGSSNVNVVAVMQTVPSRIHRWSVNITNLSADTWGISFSSVTNRWKFQSWMYGTNAPSVLTNNTILKLDGESEGTNTLVEFKYFSPAL
jgi:hypothetical protein